MVSAATIDIKENCALRAQPRESLLVQRDEVSAILPRDVKADDALTASVTNIANHFSMTMEIQVNANDLALYMYRHLGSVGAKYNYRTAGELVAAIMAAW